MFKSKFLYNHYKKLLSYIEVNLKETTNPYGYQYYKKLKINAEIGLQICSDMIEHDNHKLEQKNVQYRIKRETRYNK